MTDPQAFGLLTLVCIILAGAAYLDGWLERRNDRKERHE